MLTYLKIGAGAALGAILAYGPAYLHGRHEGRQAVVSELQDDRVTILKNGTAIDEQVYSADDLALCDLLGSCQLPDDSQAD